MICCDNRRDPALRLSQPDLAPPPMSKVASPDRFLSVAMSKSNNVTTPISEPTKAASIRSITNSINAYHNSFAPKPRIMPITAPIVAESELPPELARARLRGVLVKSESDGMLNLPPINVFTPYSVNLNLPSRIDESPSRETPSDHSPPNQHELHGPLSHYKSENSFHIPQGAVARKPEMSPQFHITHPATWASDAEPYLHSSLPPSTIQVSAPGVPVPELDPSGRSSISSTTYSSPPHSPLEADPKTSRNQTVELQPVVHSLQKQPQQVQQPVQPIQPLGSAGTIPSGTLPEVTSPYTILPERVSTAGPPINTGRVGKQPVRDPEKLKHRIWLQQNRMHQDKLHQLGFRIQEGVNGSKICSLCQTAFSKEMFVWRHAWQHVNEKPFHCTVCRQKFTRSDTLQRHVRRTGHHLNPGS